MSRPCRALAHILAVATGAAVPVAPVCAAADFFFVDSERVLAVLRQGHPEVRHVRQVIARKAAAAASWALPASTNAVYDSFVPVGESYDWVSNPTADPEFIHAAMRFEWAPALVLASQTESRPDYLDVLAAQLVSFEAFAARSGDPRREPKVRQAPVWRYINASARAWHLLQARALLPGGAPGPLQPAIEAIVRRDLDWLDEQADRALRSRQERPTNWDIILARALIAGAVLQPGRAGLYDNGMALLRLTLERCVLSDGMLWEGSISYHAVAARWFAEALLLAQRHGKPVPPESLPVLRRMAEVARNFVHADGREPAMGDSDRDRANAHAISYLSELVDVRPDRPLPPEPLLGRPGGTPAAGEILPRSFTLPRSGFAIVRNDDRSGSFIIDYGPKGGWHGHLDLFTFELFDDGQLLVVDPGRWLYDNDDPDRAWVVSTPAHNTITINGESHRAMEYAETWSGGVEVLEHQAEPPKWCLHLRHRGYDHLPGSPVVERRVETRYDGQYMLQDRVTAEEPVEVTVSLLAPSEDVRILGRRILVRIGETGLQVDLHEADGWAVTTRAAWHSPAYGVRRPATQILMNAACRECRLVYGLKALRRE